MKLNGNLTFKTLGDELRNAIIERLASDPGTTVEGRLYYNTTDNEYRYYNGSGWQPFGEGVIASNIVTASGGIYDTDGTYDGTAVDGALGNVTASTDLLDALSQLDQAVSGAAESYRIKDADTDTIVRTAATGGGDEDEVEVILGDNSDNKGPETVATFGRASTAIKGLDATGGGAAGSDVTLTGGAGNVAGAGGDVVLTSGSGNAGAGTSGNIELDVRAGTTADGVILFSSSDTLAPETRWMEQTGAEYVGFKAPDAITTAITYTLPVTPTAGYVLQTTALGVLSWVDPSGVTSLALDDLTDVNVPSPTDLDLLQWDNGTSMWIDNPIGATSGVQAYGAGLDSLSALNASNGDVIYATADDTYAVAAPGATSGVQAYDAGLDSVAGLAAVSGDVIYATAEDTYAVAQPGVTSGVQAYDAGLDSLAGLGASNGDIIYATAADTYAVAAPGATSGVQAYDANLDQIAALAPDTDNFIVGNGSAWILGTPSASRTALGLVSGGTGDIWVEKAGDTMNSAANISFVGGGEVLGLPTVPSGATAATSKEYVDQLVAAGTVWEDPIVDPNLTGVSATADPSTEANATWIAFDGSYPQTWGTIVDVEEGDVLVRNSADDDWIRIELVSTSSRFIVAADLQTNLSETDPLFVAGVRSKDLIQFESVSVLGGEVVGYAAINWFLPSQDTYQVIDFTAPKATGDSTGLANDATVYTFQVALNGTGAADNISIVGSAAQTIATLLTEINTDLDSIFGASAVIATLEDEGHIHITGQAISDYILITPGTGTDLLNTLTDYNEIRGSNVNGTTVLVSEPDSPNFGNQYTYSERGNDWTLIAGPGTVTAGTGLSKDGTVLNVNMGSGIIELPTDQVGVDLRNSASGALLLTTDGLAREGTNAASQLWLRLAGDDTGEAGSALTQDTEGLRLVLSTNSGLVITGAGTVNGTLEVNPKTATGIQINGGDGELELSAVPNSSLANSSITFSDGTNTDAVALGETTVVTGGIVGDNTLKVFSIEDADGDTTITTASGVAGDQDVITLTLGDSGDNKGPEAVATFNRTTTTIKGLDGTGSNAAGGIVNVNGGDADGTGLGGTVSITSGTAGTGGTGGDINITAAGIIASDFEPGDVTITAGSTTETGTPGGSVSISAGTTDDTGSGGNVTLTSGGTGSGSGGVITLSVPTGTVADGYVSIESAGTLAPELRFAEQTGAEFVGLKAPDAITTAVTYTLPVDPSAGYLLSTDASGVTSWIDPAAVGATRIEDLADVTAATSGSPPDPVGNILVADGVDSYDTQSVQFNYDSTLNGGASTSHTVTHSLGQRFVNVTVFDSSFNQVIPQTVVLTDTNTVTVTFNSSIQCYVVVMGIPGVGLA